MFGRNDGSQPDLSQVTPDPPAAPPMPDSVPDAALGLGDTPSEPPVLTPPPYPAPSISPLTVPGPTVDTTAAAGMPSSPPAVPDDLLTLKANALQDLSPLVSHLDQTPEEKFRTTMMLIQATDDHTKLKDAYESAKQIADDKARAQALLDVVNEINYFTQQQSQAK